jgi:hypothetical protein
VATTDAEKEEKIKGKDEIGTLNKECLFYWREMSKIGSNKLSFTCEMNSRI